MKKVIFALAVSVFALSSCVKYNDNDGLNKIENANLDLTTVNFNIKTVSMSGDKAPAKAGAYLRGDAPVYIAGVKIKSNYLDGIEKIVEGDFDFTEAKEGGEKITMNIPLGRNTFTAVSKPGTDAGNKAYTNAIKKAETDVQKNNYYSSELIKLQKIYAVFNGETTSTITTGSHDVAISMTTNHSRAGIILETSANYVIDMTVVCNGKTTKLVGANSTATSAIVLNDAELVGAKDIAIKLEVRTKNGDEIVKTIDVVNKEDSNKPFSVVGGLNRTIVMNYNSDGVLTTQVTGISFTWTPMGEDGVVIEIH